MVDEVKNKRKELAMNKLKDTVLSLNVSDEKKAEVFDAVAGVLKSLKDS